MSPAPSLCQNFLLQWEVVNKDSPKSKGQWSAHSYSITPSRFRDNFGKGGWKNRRAQAWGEVFQKDESPAWRDRCFHELVKSVPAWEWVHQHTILEEGGAREYPFLHEEILTLNASRGGGLTFFSGVVNDKFMLRKAMPIKPRGTDTYTQSQECGGGCWEEVRGRGVENG